MTRVVAVGLPVQAFVAGQPTVRAYPWGVRERDLRALADDLLSALELPEEVLVVLPRWAAEPSLDRLRTVRAALDTTRVAVYQTSLPPLAGGVLCGLAAAIGGTGATAGVLWHGLPALERQLLAVARLDRVQRFAHPRPPAALRLASLVAGTAFGVSSWPRPHVRRLRPEDRGVALPPLAAWAGVAQRRLAVTAAEDGDLSWVEECVLPVLGPIDVVQVAGGPLRALHWATPKALEAVAFPVDIPALRDVVAQGLTPVPCQWCGALVAAARCPLCGVEQLPFLPAAAGA
jgi:hypothetical protein